MRILNQLDARKEALRYRRFHHESLLHPKKSDADRRWNRERLTGWRQLPAGRVDAEFNDRVGKLILRQQKMSCRVDRKMPRLLPPGGASSPGASRADFASMA